MSSAFSLFPPEESGIFLRPAVASTWCFAGRVYMNLWLQREQSDNYKEREQSE